MTDYIINSEVALQSFIGDVREEWRDIPGLEGRYQASTHGRIRSLPREGVTCYGATRKLQGRLIAQRAGKSGYVRISSGIADTQFVHRLVARTFIPNPHGLPVVNHIDGDRANNHPENLEWCTQAENVRHGFATGLTPTPTPGRGDKSPAAKLTEAKVTEIKARLRAGAKPKELGAKYGVSASAISEIKAGRSWGHV